MHDMSRIAFNTVCSIIFIAVMLTLRHFLMLASDQFLNGLCVGIFGILTLGWVLHRMGVRLY